MVEENKSETTSNQTNWTDISEQLAEDIDDYLSNQGGNKPCSKPSLENLNLPGLLDWVDDLYTNEQTTTDLIEQKQNAMVIFRFIISEEDLETDLKSQFEQFAIKITLDPQTLRFIGSVLHKEVIQKLSKETQYSIFSNLLNNLPLTSDIYINQLYISKLMGESTLWELNEFKTFFQNMEESQKNVVVKNIFERIMASKNPEYREDIKYSRDFPVAASLTKFLSHIVILEQDQSLLEEITDFALINGISLFEFWGNLFDRQNQDHPEYITRSYVNYLKRLMVSKETIELSALFKIFKSAIRGNIVSIDLKIAFLNEFTKQYSKEYIVNGLFNDNNDYMDFLSKLE